MTNSFFSHLFYNSHIPPLTHPSYNSHKPPLTHTHKLLPPPTNSNRPTHTSA